MKPRSAPTNRRAMQLELAEQVKRQRARCTPTTTAMAAPKWAPLLLLGLAKLLSLAALASAKNDQVTGNLVYCADTRYPSCDTPGYCPATCPYTCQMDSDTCKPVCGNLVQANTASTRS